MNMGMQIQNDIGKITTIVNFLFHPSHIYLDLLLLEPGTSLGVISSQEFRYVHILYKKDSSVTFNEVEGRVKGIIISLTICVICNKSVLKTTI